MYRPEFFLGSILLEPNRWGPAPRLPEIRLSEWLPRIAAAGFDGLELWENHWLHAEEVEQAALIASPAPVRILNTYLVPSVATDSQVKVLASAVRALGATLRGLKFNLRGGDVDFDSEVAAAARWGERFSPDLTFLCECHAETAVETPVEAARAFARWPEKRFEAILHPFLGTDEAFAAWRKELGRRITHLHVQMRDGNFGLVRISHRAEFAQTRLRALRTEGFTGSLTIEFTAGVGHHPEVAEGLLANAGADLAFLRAELDMVT